MGHLLRKLICANLPKDSILLGTAFDRHLKDLPLGSLIKTTIATPAIEHASKSQCSQHHFDSVMSLAGKLPTGGYKRGCLNFFIVLNGALVHYGTHQFRNLDASKARR